MKLNAKQKEILNLLVKNKGQFKTPTIPKDHYAEHPSLSLCPECLRARFPGTQLNLIECSVGPIQSDIPGQLHESYGPR